MAKLIYSSIMSLDGFVADSDGNFDWGRPDDSVMSFVNDLERPVGTYLYGRRMYETMRPSSWEAANGHGPAMFSRGSNCWTRAASTTGPSISAIAPLNEMGQASSVNSKSRSPGAAPTEGGSPTSL